MGQQQLLLIVLGVIIVGIAIAVAITVFSTNASSSNTDAVLNDLNNLAAKAQQHYIKPVSMGGGGNSFTGWTLSPSDTGNDNGSYSVGSVSATQVIMKAVGTRPGTKDPTKTVECYVTVTATAIQDSVRY
jgi:Tfp pilus assembly protein PilE